MDHSSEIAKPGSTEPRSLFRSAKWLGLYLLLAVVAYWPISFMRKSLKWDMLDVYLPWRYFVGDSLQHGVFPLWNPFQHLGYPIYGDMRSVFYPETLLVGLFNGYTPITMNVLVILYMAFAGLGMYLLSGHFTHVRAARGLAGAAYVLSGYFVGHGQELTGIVAGAWIPFVLHYYLRFLRTREYADLTNLSIFLILQLTGGYQALSIILAYLLAVFFLVELAGLIRRKERGAVRVLLVRHAALVGVMLAVLSVLVLTFVRIAPSIERFGGMSLSAAEFCPLTPRSLISLLMPFAVVSDKAYFGTDISMSNFHVGLLVLIAFLAALFRRNGPRELVLLGFGLIALLASMGTYAPVRAWLFHYVPLMDLFRMAAFFSYFTLLAVVLLGSAELGKWIDAPEERRWRPWVFGSVVLGAILLVMWSLLKGFDRSAFDMLAYVNERSNIVGDVALAPHVWVHGTIQVALLFCFGALWWFAVRKGRGMVLVLSCFLLVEMGIAVRLNSPATVEGETGPAWIQKELRATPAGFPLPDLQVPVGHWSDSKPDLGPLWRNTNIFTKTVSVDGFNSFQLNSFNAMEHDTMGCLRRTLQQPVLFLSGNVCSLRSARNDSSCVIVPDGYVDELRRVLSPSAESDLIELTTFDPGRVNCRVSIAGPKLLTLVQMKDPGWKATVDGRDTELIEANKGVLAVVVPAGVHMISFRYERPDVLAAFGLSALTFSLVLFLALYFALRRYAGWGQVKALSVAGAVLLGAIATVGFKAMTARDMERTRLEAYSGMLPVIQALPTSGIQIIAQVDRPALLDSLLATIGNVIPVHYLPPYRDEVQDTVRSLVHQLASDSSTLRVVYVQMERPRDPVTDELLMHEFPVRGTIPSLTIGTVSYERGPKRKGTFYAELDFEQPNAEWPFDMAHTDTSVVQGGGHSWPINEENPGSPGLVRTLAEYGAVSAARITFELSARVDAAPSNAVMYIEVERAGKKIWQHNRSITDVPGTIGRWRRFISVGEPPFELRPDDVIRIFVWGGQGTVHVDDMSVTFNASE